MDKTPFIPDVKLRRLMFRVYIQALFPFEFWQDIFKLDLECKQFVAKAPTESFSLNEDILSGEKQERNSKITPPKEEKAPSGMKQTPQSQGSKVRFEDQSPVKVKMYSAAASQPSNASSVLKSAMKEQKPGKQQNPSVQQKFIKETNVPSKAVAKKAYVYL